MALTQKKIPRKKLLQLGAILGIVFLVAAFVVYTSFIRIPKIDEPNIGQGSSGLEFGIQENGFAAYKALLSHSVYQMLEKFGPWPLSPEPRGNPNPFIQITVEEEEE